MALVNKAVTCILYICGWVTPKRQPRYLTLDWFLVTVQFVWRWSLGTVVVASPIIEYHSFMRQKLMHRRI